MGNGENDLALCGWMELMLAGGAVFRVSVAFADALTAILGASQNTLANHLPVLWIKRLILDGHVRSWRVRKEGQRGTENRLVECV